VLADRYDIDRWRGPAYLELCTRERPLQESEASLLGMKVSMQLAEVRERVLLEMLYEGKRGSPMETPGLWGLPRMQKDIHRVERLIEEVFWPHLHVGAPIAAPP
jgi:hypothetical protein